MNPESGSFQPELDETTLPTTASPSERGSGRLWRRVRNVFEIVAFGSLIPLTMVGLAISSEIANRTGNASHFFAGGIITVGSAVAGLRLLERATVCDDSS